jgi:putative transposase
LEQVAAEHGWEIVAKEVTSDFAHLSVRAGPTDAPADVVRALTGRTAAVFVLWSPWYRAASVGSVSESTLRRFFARQWDVVAL